MSLFFVAVAAWLYMRGIGRISRFSGWVPAWQQALFLAGLACILIATNAPLAPLGHKLFSVHQAEHLLLRLAGPLLIAASQPWRFLLAGLTRRWRRRLRAFGNNAIIRFMAHPVSGGRVGLSAENPFNDFALLFSANDIRLLG